MGVPPPQNGIAIGSDPWPFPSLSQRQELLGIPAAEQRLLNGASILDEEAAPFELMAQQGAELQVRWGWAECGVPWVGVWDSSSKIQYVALPKTNMEPARGSLLGEGGLPWGRFHGWPSKSQCPYPTLRFSSQRWPAEQAAPMTSDQTGQQKTMSLSRQDVSSQRRWSSHECMCQDPKVKDFPMFRAANVGRWSQAIFLCPRQGGDGYDTEMYGPHGLLFAIKPLRV